MSEIAVQKIFQALVHIDLVELKEEWATEGQADMEEVVEEDVVA